VTDAPCALYNMDDVDDDVNTEDMDDKEEAAEPVRDLGATKTDTSILDVCEEDKVLDAIGDGIVTDVAA
jgi:hypothetical protein